MKSSFGTTLAGPIGDTWDKPVVPMPQVERQLLSQADVRCLSARRGVMTEAGPVAVCRLLKSWSAKADITAPTARPTLMRRKRTGSEQAPDRTRVFNKAAALASSTKCMQAFENIASWSMANDCADITGAGWIAKHSQESTLYSLLGRLRAAQKPRQVRPLPHGLPARKWAEAITWPLRARRRPRARDRYRRLSGPPPPPRHWQPKRSRAAAHRRVPRVREPLHRSPRAMLASPRR